MTAKILPASEEVVRPVASCLAAGALVVLPTDTVYGLAADAFLPDAVAAVYRVKSRSLDKPLSVLLGDPQDVRLVASEIPPIGEQLAERFWPGGLTIIFRKSSKVPDLLTAGQPSVGVRVPNHPIARAIISALGAPVTGTSANLSGWPSPRTAAEARVQLEDKVDVIVDAGPSPGGVESTIVDVTVDPPLVVRLGAVTLEQLREVCAEVSLAEEWHSS